MLSLDLWINSKKEKSLQAILDYYKNYKRMEESAWNDNSFKILLNYKDATLMWRSLKRIHQDMKDEAEVLNEFKKIFRQKTGMKRLG